MGSVISLCALAVILGLVIRFLTGNEGLAFSVSLLLIIIIGIAGFVDISSFEGLLPKIMNRLSLFELLLFVCKRCIRFYIHCLLCIGNRVLFIPVRAVP